MELSSNDNYLYAQSMDDAFKVSSRHWKKSHFQIKTIKTSEEFSLWKCNLQVTWIQTLPSKLVFRNTRKTVPQSTGRLHTVMEKRDAVLKLEQIV